VCEREREREREIEREREYLDKERAEHPLGICAGWRVDLV
jgi:hypothetical protein